MPPLLIGSTRCSPDNGGRWRARTGAALEANPQGPGSSHGGYAEAMPGSRGSRCSGICKQLSHDVASQRRKSDASPESRVGPDRTLIFGLRPGVAVTIRALICGFNLQKRNPENNGSRGFFSLRTPTRSETTQRGRNSSVPL